ncbi:ABC transporter ATP-binding protein [Sulfurimonas sp.]|uniref:ABC transporter ATP-binding protein n=1 Tax=Sulfurimonas sp. TaxID=2022749 RepID=UPI002AB15F0A|nr:ATP-binding cassette domain-containing protein [Sulfurimonas sp.]
MIKININTDILSLKLEINEGDFIALSGKSGSGKTTLLRVLAGLETAHGNIEVNGDSWLSDKVNLAPQKREIGFIFQDYALFTNMSVLKNLLYMNNDIKLATHLLDITELSTMKDRLPSTLSGGQKQRVALCRAMMNKPKLLLMDEPLSALDAQMRTKLQNELLTLHKEFKTTTIMVSHDPSEIYRLASRVVVLEDGKIINDGTPKDVLLRTSGSQKFSFSGQILEIKRVDAIFIAIIAIGQQLVEVVLSDSEAQGLEVSQMVEVSTKAFSPILSKINK